MRRFPLVIGSVVLAGAVATSFLIYVAQTSGSFRPLLGISTASKHSQTPPPLDNQDHLYVLDGFGGLHPVGASPALSVSASWPHEDIAFSLALFPDGTGGYVMDGWGKLHPVGSAPAVDSGVYWPHWIGAREIVMAPWSSASAPAGYLLDADGGIHPFGGARPVSGNTTWPSQGIARGLVLMPSAIAASVSGYTLDGFGGVHPFGGAPPVLDAATFSGDMARGIALVQSRGLGVAGYTLDFSGGIHAFGGAPAMGGLSLGRDEADSLVAWTAAPAGSPGGWVLDRHGDVYAWGSAPRVSPTATWPGWDIARGLAGAGSGGGSTERLILDAQPLRNGWGSYFNQRDARWASNSVAGTFPVWKIGCLLSDLAMVYSHFGFGGVTPASIAAHGGWFDGRGDMYNGALNVPGHPFAMVMNPPSGWVAAQVGAGRPVIVGMNLPSGGTHFVVLTGRDGPSDYWVNDPWEQNAMHVSFSGDWFTRGPIYEGIAFS